MSLQPLLLTKQSVLDMTACLKGIFDTCTGPS